MTEKLRLREHALEWREVEGEIVALDLSTSSYLTVNRAGATLWRSLAAGATYDELTRSLIAEYGLDENAAAKDVHTFLAQLKEQGLVQG